jgi:hypothetical protein
LCPLDWEFIAEDGLLFGRFFSWFAIFWLLFFFEHFIVGAIDIFNDLLGNKILEWGCVGILMSGGWWTMMYKCCE